MHKYLKLQSHKSQGSVDLSLSPLRAGRTFFELAKRGILNKNIVYEKRCLDYARHKGKGSKRGYVESRLTLESERKQSFLSLSLASTAVEKPHALLQNHINLYTLNYSN